MKRHFGVFRIAGKQFTTLAEKLKVVDGIEITHSSPSKLQGTLLYHQDKSIKTLDENKVEVVKVVHTIRPCHFTLLPTSTLIYVEESRGDLNRVADILNGLEGVACEIRDFELDVVGANLEFMQANAKYYRPTIRSVKVKDYLAREGMLTTASFKFMEPSKIDEILTKYRSEVLCLNCELEGKDEKIKYSIDRKGTVKFHGGPADSMGDEIAGMLMKFNDDPVVTEEQQAIQVGGR